jgi:PHD/YefM family antitoxin component YafN of YafNO toxin-antitoxin module
MLSLTVTQAKKQLSRLIDHAGDFYNPVRIIGSRGSAVLMSDEDWSSIQETLYLHSMPGIGKSVVKGLKTPIGKCSAVSPFSRGF